MPKDLPGFYFDAEKNRYFPTKSPIPGSTSRNHSKSVQKPPTLKSNQAKDAQKPMRAKVNKMLLDRELCGKAITSNKRKVDFQEQYRKLRASKPIIWKYQGTQRIADAALEHVCVDIQTPGGLTETEILLTGGLSGTLCLYEVGNVGQLANFGVKCMPDRVQPVHIEEQKISLKSPELLWRPTGALIQISDVSCIKMARKYYRQATDSASPMPHALITTLGSETSGGSVYLMNLSEPLDYGPSIAMMSQRIDEISIFNSTIWTADSNSDGSRAVIGYVTAAGDLADIEIGNTHLTPISWVQEGIKDESASVRMAQWPVQFWRIFSEQMSELSLVHTESGARSWICRSKSDVLSLQFDYSGNIVLCGLRNGAIVTIDARQKPEDLSARHTRHQIPYPFHKTGGPSSRRGQKREKQWFELKGNIRQSQLVYMPSSVSCLAALKLFDQYFLASSMDGTMKLYDHRLIQRGAVQSYEGNVNSHTRVQLGVDPSERFVISGGEDFYLRAWSIKSGELLYEDKFMSSVPSIVCWPGGAQDATSRDENYWENHFPGAWLGSQEGLFYMHNS